MPHKNEKENVLADFDLEGLEFDILTEAMKKPIYNGDTNLKIELEGRKKGRPPKEKEEKLPERTVTTKIVIDNSLSAKENKAIELWLEGKSKKEISDDLGVENEEVDSWFESAKINSIIEKTKTETREVYKNKMDNLVPLAIERLTDILSRQGEVKDQTMLIAIGKAFEISGFTQKNNSTTNNINNTTQIIIKPEYEPKEIEADFVEVKTMDLTEKELEIIEVD